MSRNRIILIVSAILIFGVVAFLVFGNSDEENNQSNTSDNTTTQTDEQTPDESAFAPLGMRDQAFEATVNGTDAEGNEYQMLLQYDGEGRSRMAGEQDGTRFETVFTSDAFYSCEGENCVKFPVSQSESAPFSPGEYVYEDDDFESFQESATYIGKEDCPAGTCDVWEVVEDDHTSRLFLDSNRRISKVEGNSDDGTVTISYEFKDVSIEIPQNAQTIPTLEQ